MGFGDWLKDVGDHVAGGIADVAWAGNVLDRYINPFHVEAGSKQHPVTEQERATYDRAAGLSVNASVEQVAQWTQWLRHTVVSHPLSTWDLMTAQAYAHPDRLFSTSEWARAWRVSRNVSPGQALMATSQFVPSAPFFVPKAGGSAEAEKILSSKPQYYSPSAADMPAGFSDLSPDEQQEALKQAGMPVIGNRYIEEMRQASRGYKYGSGAVDFGLAWYADPTIVGGKTLGALRASRVTRVRPPAGWSTATIDKMLSESRMNKLQKYLWEHKDNPQLINNLAFAQNSAMGPRFGNIVSKAQGEEDINLLLRVGMGDMNALERLHSQNEQIGMRLQALNDRYDHLDLARGRWAHNKFISAQIDQQMSDLERFINADEATVLRYNQIADHAFELDRLNLSRWSFSRAAARTEAENAYRAGAAYGYKAQREGVITPTLPAIAKSSWTARTPIEGGMIKQRVWGAGDFFSKPVTVVRAMHNSQPNGWMRIDDLTRDNIAELRAQVARIPNITAANRQEWVNRYLSTTTEGERMAFLDDMETVAAGKVAEKHGLGAEAGRDIYQEWKRQQAANRNAGDPSAKAFSGTMVPSRTGVGKEIRVWEFEAQGGRLVPHPHTVTRLKNSHVFLDLDEMDKVLARHSSALSALRMSKFGNPDWLLDGADFLTGLFKVSVLFRLGYIPRVLGDDITGQWAAAGSAAMAARAITGLKNTGVNAYRALAHPWAATRESVTKAQIEYADDEIRIVTPQLAKLKGQLAAQHKSNQRFVNIATNRLLKVEPHYRALNPSDRSAKALQIRNQYSQAKAQVQAANMKLTAGPSKGKTQFITAQEQRLKMLQQYRDLAERKLPELEKWRTVERQGNKGPVIDGIRFPAPFEGREGQLMSDVVSADNSIGNLFHTTKQLMQGNLMRSFDHGGRVIRASENEVEHARAWAHAINNQIMQDPLEKMAVGRVSADGVYHPGANIQEMANWLRRTAEGRQYRRRIGLALATPEELARRAKAEVDDYMHLPEIRQKALEGQVDGDFLMKSVPRQVDRPEVHTGMVGMQGQGGFQQGLDRVQQKWFNFAATIPANRMSRHPLYNQLYDGHVRIVANQLKKQGGFTVSDVNMITRSARRLALRDTRRLVFDIAHRSDAAAALRFLSPFFSATSEAFQRWGRIIADKPQIVGYGTNFFNSPLALGAMQDADGNNIMRDGTRMVKDPDTGKWKREIVPKSERWIVGRVPGWLASSPVGVFFGMEQSSGNFALSQNSMNIVTQGDPWFNPGVGPIVQIPVNELVKDKPTEGEIARKLGILPFGPDTTTNPVARGAGYVVGAPFKNLYTALDNTDERYQAVKMHIMQRAAWEHENLGKPMLSAEQINAQTRDYWFFSAASSFSQPFATKRRDAYQFYRDEYNKLRRQDPVHADQNFLDRYGESYFVFAQAQSRNVTGIQATKKAYALSKEYADLISEFPELGALIVGPEGNGPFSPEVYSYQLNHPITPGGTEMERTRLSAEEAMKENQRRLGWSKFMSRMNGLRAQLEAGGFKSFNDKGAEALKLSKRAIVMMYGDPLLPDGTENPFYNEEWSRDYYSYDVRKNDRMALALSKVIENDSLLNDPRRTDLRLLQQYLEGRKMMNQALIYRKASGGASTLNAKTNEDLANGWMSYVDGLVEQSTDFEDLYNRYLSRDLGIDATPEES